MIGFDYIAQCLLTDSLMHQTEILVHKAIPLAWVSYHRGALLP